MPTALFIFAVFAVSVIMLSEYMKVEVIERIKWEYSAFVSEQISEKTIVLPNNCDIPFYTRRALPVKAREEFFEWVPSEELKPTGHILVGNKGVRWIEVINGYVEGYIPEPYVSLTKVFPVRYIKNMYQY